MRHGLAYNGTVHQVFFAGRLVGQFKTLAEANQFFTMLTRRTEVQ